jgi:hypothetical protein
MLSAMSDGGDADVGRAPICAECGVTALPAETANVLDSGFICENPDCEAFGEAVSEGWG